MTCIPVGATLFFSDGNHHRYPVSAVVQLDMITSCTKNSATPLNLESADRKSPHVKHFQARGMRWQFQSNQSRGPFFTRRSRSHPVVRVKGGASQTRSRYAQPMQTQSRRYWTPLEPNSNAVSAERRPLLISRTSGWAVHSRLSKPSHTPPARSSFGPSRIHTRASDTDDENP
ncbi:hypothetical protein H4582DRAFT_1323566 [Lactarius indigo]|nr:hypothetical protein H4582DRAFT_1323566 [Lactarius indigo]